MGEGTDQANYFLSHGWEREPIEPIYSLARLRERAGVRETNNLEVVTHHQIVTPTG